MTKEEAKYRLDEIESDYEELIIKKMQAVTAKEEYYWWKQIAEANKAKDTLRAILEGSE